MPYHFISTSLGCGVPGENSTQTWGERADITQTVVPAGNLFFFFLLSSVKGIWMKGCYSSTCRIRFLKGLSLFWLSTFYSNIFLLFFKHLHIFRILHMKHFFKVAYQMSVPVWLSLYKSLVSEPCWVSNFW